MPSLAHTASAAMPHAAAFPCGHVLQTLGSAEALGSSPCGLRGGGICLPGLGQTALLEESTANAQEAFQLLPVALAGRLWCDGCCLQWVVPKQRRWHSPLPALARELRLAASHLTAPLSCVVAAVAVVFSLLEVAGKPLQVFNLVALGGSLGPLAPDVVCGAVTV